MKRYTDLYIKFEGVEHNSSDLSYSGWSRLYGLDLKLFRRESSWFGGWFKRRSVGFELQCRKPVDVASPMLSTSFTQKTALSQIEIHGSWDQSNPFFAYLLLDVSVEKYSIYQDGFESGAETFELNFAQMQFDYFDRDQEGSVIEHTTYRWNT